MSGLSRREIFKLAGAGAAACVLPAAPKLADCITIAAGGVTTSDADRMILLCNAFKRSFNEHLLLASASEPAHQS